MRRIPLTILLIAAVLLAPFINPGSANAASGEYNKHAGTHCDTYNPYLFNQHPFSFSIYGSNAEYCINTDTSTVYIRNPHNYLFLDILALSPITSIDYSDVTDANQGAAHIAHQIEAYATNTTPNLIIPPKGKVGFQIPNSLDTRYIVASTAANPTVGAMSYVHSTLKAWDLHNLSDIAEGNISKFVAEHSTEEAIDEFVEAGTSRSNATAYIELLVAGLETLIYSSNYVIEVGQTAHLQLTAYDAHLDPNYDYCHRVLLECSNIVIDDTFADEYINNTPPHPSISPCEGGGSIAVVNGNHVNLKHNLSPSDQTDTDFHYGNGTYSGNQYLSGDWNGDGVDTPAVVIGNVVHMRASNNPASEVIYASYPFGNGTHVNQYLAGDWDGDGDDELGVVIGNVAHLRHNNNPTSGTHAPIPFGNGVAAGNQYIAGNWSGSEHSADEIGVVIGNHVYLRKNLNPADHTNFSDFTFGNGTHQNQYMAGDWSGDNHDSVAVVIGNTTHIRYNNHAQDHRICTPISFGNGVELGNQYLAGDWN